MWHERNLIYSPDDGGDGGQGADGGSGQSGGSGNGSGGAGGAGTLFNQDGQQGQQGQQGGQEGQQGQQDAGVAQSFFIGLMDEKGQLNKDNFDRLPENLQPYKEMFSQYDTVDALLGGLANAKRLASKKGIDTDPLPPDAPKEMVEERQNLIRKLNGAPDDPSQYGFAKPDDYPDELPWNEEQVNNYASILQKHGASPALAKELFEAQMEQAKNSGTEVQQVVEQRLTEERTKLANEFGDKTPQALDMAKRAIQTLGWKDGDQPVDMNHPIFATALGVRMANQIAELTKEDELVGGEGIQGGKAPREAALDIVNNPDNPYHKAYWDAEDPLHDKAVNEKQRLDQLARKASGGS